MESLQDLGATATGRDQATEATARERRGGNLELLDRESS